MHQEIGKSQNSGAASADASPAGCKLMGSPDEVLGTGIWTKDLRKRTGLSQPIVARAIKALESRQLVKAVKSVNYANRKYYMLFDMEPSQQVTGGAWWVPCNILDKTPCMPNLIASLSMHCSSLPVACHTGLCSVLPSCSCTQSHGVFMACMHASPHGSPATGAAGPLEQAGRQPWCKHLSQRRLMPHRYTEQEFDKDFTDVLYDQSFKAIRQLGSASVEDVADAVNKSVGPHARLHSSCSSY